MASYVPIDPHGMFSFEDDGGKVSLIVKDDEGYQIKVRLKSDHMGLFAYHASQYFFEMTGERPHLPQGMYLAAPEAASLTAPAPRVRTRPATPPVAIPAPRVRTRA